MFRIWGQFPNNHGTMNFRPYWILGEGTRSLTDDEIDKHCPWYWELKI